MWLVVRRKNNEQTRQRITLNGMKKIRKNYDKSDVFSDFVVVLCHVFFGFFPFHQKETNVQQQQHDFVHEKVKKIVQAIKRKSITHMSGKPNSKKDDVQSAYHEELVTLFHMLFVLTLFTAWPNYYGYDVFI